MSKKYKRIPWGKEPSICQDDWDYIRGDTGIGVCHDCGAKEGELHEYGCDMEECPVCHRQLMGCEEKCLKKINNNRDLLTRYRKNVKETGNGMGFFVDSNGDIRVKPFWRKK